MANSEITKSPVYASLFGRGLDSRSARLRVFVAIVRFSPIDEVCSAPIYRGNIGRINAATTNHKSLPFFRVEASKARLGRDYLGRRRAGHGALFHKQQYTAGDHRDQRDNQ